MEHGHARATFLAQLILLLVVGRLLGEAMQRIGQPPVMGQLIAGLLLGKSVLGAFAPELQHLIFPDDAAQRRMLQAVSEVGVLLLLLLTGMETNLDAVRAMRRPAMAVSLCGIVIPFGCGVALGLAMPASLLPHPELRMPTALFLGTALSISSVKVVAAVVRDMGFLNRRVGRVMVSAAIVDDTLAWIVIAVTASFAIHGSVSLGNAVRTLLAVALFLAFAMTLGRRAVVWTIRWANDRLAMEMGVITAIIVMTAAFALATDLIGVHTVLGAFVAGLLVGRSPILTRKVDAQLRGLIVAFFMPVFFGAAGLSADLRVLLEPRMALFALMLVAIASVGKFAGAYAGGMLGGLTVRESGAIAWGMNARGSTEIIVATIGLSIGALSQDLFTMIVAMAVLTTLMMPPALRWALRRVPVSAQERADEERERAEATQFLPQLERILAVVDASDSGRLAARIVGLLAATTRKLTAVMDIVHDAAPSDGTRTSPHALRDEHGAQIARASAHETARAAGADAGRDAHAGAVATTVAEVATDAPHLKPDAAPTPSALPPSVETAEPERRDALPESVAAELRKGYDLVVLGLDDARGEDSPLAAMLGGIESTYQGARAFVFARARDVQAPLRILLPVTGADYSRRGAEVAIALAAASEAPLSVLAVARRAAPAPRLQRRRGRALEDRATIEAIRELAGQRGVTILPRLVEGEEPIREIAAHARRIGATLIVLGVKERPGPVPSFGPTAEGVLHDAPCSVLLLST